MILGKKNPNKMKKARLEPFILGRPDRKSFTFTNFHWWGGSPIFKGTSFLILPCSLLQHKEALLRYFGESLKK